MRTFLQFALPIAIVGLAGLGIWLMVSFKPDAQPASNKAAPPLVDFVIAETVEGAFTVRTQGTVEPRSEIDLVTQVSGRLTFVAPSLQDGGQFSAGDLLVTLDDSDYKAAAAQRKADVADAELVLAQEQAEAENAVEQWNKRNPNESAPPLVARKPQLVRAQARVEAARAALLRAELDLQRATIRAPFAGRVRERLVDNHQVVNAGQALARIYAVDWVDIRLPVADSDLGDLEMPFVLQPADETPSGPEVTLHARFGGREWSWPARIHRTAGSVDPQTRRVTLVARVGNPYEAHDGERPPLQVGMFVEAEIQGRSTEGLLAVPRSAIRNGSQVVTIDEEDKLRIRDVDIVRADETAWIREGIEAGARVCTSNMQVVVDGMQVTVDDSDRAGLLHRTKRWIAAELERMTRAIHMDDNADIGSESR